MENPIEMDDLGIPFFGNTQMDGWQVTIRLPFGDFAYFQVRFLLVVGSVF